MTAITAAAAAARQTCAALARAPACPTSPAGWPPRCRRPSRCCTACTASTRNRMPDGAQRPLKHTADWSRSAHADAKRTFDGSRTTPEATCENLHLAPKLRKRARAACSRRIDMWSKGRAHRQWPAWEYSKHSGPATDAALVQKESERRRSCAIDGARRGRCRSGRAREYCAVGGWAGGKERVRGFHAAEFWREEARTRRVGDVVVVIDDGSSGAVCGRVPPTCGSGCSECAVPLGTQAGGVRTVRRRCACRCLRQAKDVVRRDGALEFVARVPVSTVELPELFVGHCHDASATESLVAPAAKLPGGSPAMRAAATPESTPPRAHTRFSRSAACATGSVEPCVAALYREQERSSCATAAWRRRLRPIRTVTHRAASISS